MKIVVLDGYALNPGDLDWSDVKKLGECEIYERSSRDEVVARAKGAEAVLVDKVVFDFATISMLPQLKYIGVTATGTNIIDVKAASGRGIIVTNVPAYSTPTVAQAVFALLLELTNHTALHDRSVHEGMWSASRDFCYWEKPITEIDGFTMGVVGFGSIGRAVARIAHAFGMKIIAHARTPKNPDHLPVEFVPLDDVFVQSDVVSLHCPLTNETRDMVDARRLKLMKKSALFINTARGPLVDEAALAEALNNNRIAGAGLDVLSAEPPPADNPLLTARNCIITPHIAWASVAARQRLMSVTVDNLSAYIKGQPVNVVSA